MKTVIGEGRQNYRTAGLILIGAGLIIILDQTIKTGWLSLLVMPCLGMMAFVYGIRRQRMAIAIPGGLISGLGWGGFFLLNQLMAIPQFIRMGLLLACLGLGFLSITSAAKIMGRIPAYWGLIPGMMLLGVGLPFILDRINVFNFIFYGITALGISFLAWGIFQRLLGLIIPGCLLVGIGPGIYFGWSKGGMFNGLTETGVMLVWFALGWGLITIISRVIAQRFIWWPLIPGGLLAVVGWGLYIGGDPSNALAFIGNTGSVGLMIFGIYLLLLRRGFKE
jgi:hypothetical protein